MAENDKKTILITGATGKQGFAVVSSLLSTDAAANRFRILALTRNPSSPASKTLLSLSPGKESGVELTLVQGDLDDPASIRKLFEEAGKGGIWSVFSILAFPGLGANADGEEKQGILLADLSLEYGVSHFIYSSAERGGEVFDDHSTFDRRAKVNIERHIKSLSTKGFKWTILRPVFFMENFDGTIGKLTTAVLRCGLQPTTKIQFAVDDIGHVAATVFLNPEPHVGEIIIVAGDVLTAKEQDEAYMRATGRHLPTVPDIVAKTILALNLHTRNLISDMERVHRDRSAMDGGYERVIQPIKDIYPGIMSFEEWAKKRTISGITGNRNRGWNRGWNQVSITALILGRR